jgi:hypothetical protein
MTSKPKQQSMPAVIPGMDERSSERIIDQHLRNRANEVTSLTRGGGAACGVAPGQDARF